jgi:hypothetical protein
MAPTRIISDGPEFQELTYIDCEVTTAKAVLLVLQNGRRLWVPKSLLDSEEQMPEANDMGGEHGACFVRQWFLEKNGLG